MLDLHILNIFHMNYQIQLLSENHLIKYIEIKIFIVPLSKMKSKEKTHNYNKTRKNTSHYPKKRGL